MSSINHGTIETTSSTCEIISTFYKTIPSHIQICNTLTKLGADAMRIKCQALIGDPNADKEVDRLLQGVHVCISTPERVAYMIKNDAFGRCCLFVLY
jgi:hypothetical protein